MGLQIYIERVAVLLIRLGLESQAIEEVGIVRSIQCGNEELMKVFLDRNLRLRVK